MNSVLKGNLRQPRVAPRSGLPASRAGPSIGHSVPNHRRLSCRRFRTQPLSATGLGPLQGSPLWVRLGFASISQARQRNRPKRVRFTTDCSFIFRCFPPLLAETQLRSITGWSVHAWRGLSPLCTSTLAGAQDPSTSLRSARDDVALVYCRGTSPPQTQPPITAITIAVATREP